MDHVFQTKVRGVRPHIPLTTRVLNSLTREAYDITTDPAMMIEKHEWLQETLESNAHIVENLAAHQDAIQSSFESALSHALFMAPSEELMKEDGHAHILEAVTPETIGQLQERLLESVEYAKASLSQIKGLEPDAAQYCLHVYAELQNHLDTMGQEILSKPKVRGVD